MKHGVAKSAALIVLAAIIFSLGGCTKCGWIWDQGRACHSDAPR